MPPREVNDDGGNIGVKVYNIVVLVIDIVILLVKWWYYAFEAVYKNIFPPEEISVKGERVLITGTGHGMGKELAFQYSDLGATIVCVDINEKLNSETVKEIQSRGGKAHGYVCDVASRDEIVKLAKLIKSEVGSITIIVNNAGIMPTHPLLEHTEAEIKKIFDINVFAHFWILQEFVPDMIKNNKGHIVALSSMAGIIGVPNLVPYCGSKFAVRGLMEAFSQELRLDARKPNIKFTNVYPYMVDTGLCKRPFMRFKNVMKLIKSNEAAAAIISAQRRGIQEISIPRHLHYVNAYSRLFPIKCGILLGDFLDSGVHSDL